MAVDLPGEFRELAGQVVCDDPLRRDAPPVKLTDSLDLRRSESGQVAVDLFDVRSLVPRPLNSLLEFLRADPFFHPVEEGGPAVRAEGCDPPLWLVRPTCRTGRGFLPDLHNPLESMSAGFAFIFVDRHGLPRGLNGPLPLPQIQEIHNMLRRGRSSGNGNLP